MRRKQIVISFEDDWVWAYPVTDEWWPFEDDPDEFDKRYPEGFVTEKDNSWIGILETTWQSDDLVPGLGVADKHILSIEIKDLPERLDNNE